MLFVVVLPIGAVVGFLALYAVLWLIAMPFILIWRAVAAVFAPHDAWQQPHERVATARPPLYWPLHGPPVPLLPSERARRADALRAARRLTHDAPPRLLGYDR
jgi:hypothetical protein